MLESLAGYLYNVDASIFYLINVQMSNLYFNFAFPIITEAGTLLFWFIICGILFIFGKDEYRKIVILCILALIFSYYVSEILKILIARPRPFLILYGVNHLTDINGFSFPSGHAVTAFAACTIFGIKFKQIYVFMAFACLVGFSRIYLGAHYPSDVIFGAFIGILCSLFILMFENDISSYYDNLKQYIVSKKQFLKI
jgi:undecaprenyl-diphosphatase